MTRSQYEAISQALMKLRGIAESGWRVSRNPAPSPVPELFSVIAEALRRSVTETTEAATENANAIPEEESETPTTDEDLQFQARLPEGTQAFRISDNCFDLIRLEPYPGLWNNGSWDMLGAVPNDCHGIRELTKILVDTAKFLIQSQAPTDRHASAAYWDVEASLKLAMVLNRRKHLEQVMTFVQPNGALMFTRIVGRETRRVTIQDRIGLYAALATRYRADETADTWKHDFDLDAADSIETAADFLMVGGPRSKDNPEEYRKA